MGRQARIAKELRDCRTLSVRHEGRTVTVCGVDVYCAPRVFPPANRVTGRLAATVRHYQGECALDLGCGTGILGLIMAKRFRRVVCVDLCPLAVSCARANASKHDVRNVSVHVGTGFGPVRDMRFDTIVCNPPFYPSDNDKQVSYRKVEQGLIGDFVEGLSGALTRNGVGLLATSSLTDNDWIAENLRRNGSFNVDRLKFNGMMRFSQDIYIWRITRGLREEAVRP